MLSLNHTDIYICKQKFHLRVEIREIKTKLSIFQNRLGCFVNNPHILSVCLGCLHKRFIALPILLAVFLHIISLVHETELVGKEPVGYGKVLFRDDSGIDFEFEFLFKTEYSAVSIDDNFSGVNARINVFSDGDVHQKQRSTAGRYGFRTVRDDGVRVKPRRRQKGVGGSEFIAVGRTDKAHPSAHRPLRHPLCGLLCLECLPLDVYLRRQP